MKEICKLYLFVDFDAHKMTCWRKDSWNIKVGRNYL